MARTLIPFLLLIYMSFSNLLHSQFTENNTLVACTATINNIIPVIRDNLDVNEIVNWQMADVIISLGQSNSISNRGINPDLIPDIETFKPVWIYSVANDGKKWHGKNEPLIYKKNTGNRYSTMDIYAHYWAAHTENQVIHFKHAKGGSSLESTPHQYDWNVNTRGELYDKFLSNWDNFILDCYAKKIIPNVVLINWAQGENETYGPHKNRNKYASWWRKLRSGIDQKIGYQNRWLVWTLHPNQYGYDPTNKQLNVKILRNIFFNKIGKEPSVTIFDTSVFPDPLYKDKIHYDEPFIIAMADYIFQNVINNLDN